MRRLAGEVQRLRSIQRGRRLGAALVAAASVGFGRVSELSCQPAAELRGRVVTAMRAGLAGAEVIVDEAGQPVTTDSAGYFRISGVAPGLHFLKVRRIGYNAQLLSADVRSGESRTFEIVMQPGPQELPEIRVTARAAKPIEYAWTTRFDDFFRRRKNGVGGSYFTRADIEAWSPLRTANILARVPGVHLRFRHLGPSGTDVNFVRCQQVSVWVDGRKETRPNIPRRQGRADTTGMALSELLERTPPSQIEMMEVYRGPSEIPAEFLDDSCAAVVIWTR